jgi:signal peptidase I
VLPDVDSPPVGTAEPVSASVRGPADVPGLDPIPVPSPATVTSGSGRWVLEWAVVLAAALLLAVGVRTYVAQMFFIPSGSMQPTLQIGERIVVDKLSYHLHGVHRGDIVVFRRPPLEQADYSDLVKRVIGLPGETISSVHGRVFINGKPLDEPWLPQPLPVTSPSPLPDGFSLNHPYTIPAGEYFVMGDNRTDSEDSRYFGPIAGNLIVGKMAFEVWPLSDTGWMVVLSVVALVVLVLLLLALQKPRETMRATGPPVRGPPGAART